MIEIPFIGQSYHLDSLKIDTQSCINLYPETYEDNKTKTVMSLRTTPGLLPFGTISGVNSMRALYQSSTSRLFAVRGDQFSELNSTGTETTRFTMITGASLAENQIVKIADNGVSMLITDGSAGQVYNLSTDVTTKVTDVDYPGGSHVSFLDGFFLMNKPDSLFMYYSAIDDPTSWNSLNNFSKESSSDFIVSHIVFNGRVWVFGAQSYEVFYNTGDSNNQFLPVDGVNFSIGCDAPFSVAENGKSVFWLASNAQGFGQIYRSNGFEPVSISTQPIEREIQSYSMTSDAEAFCYQQDGHEFYQISFPTEQRTWDYDLVTGMWHERSYNDAGTREQHLARVQASFNGKNYVGDRRNGNVYEFSQTTYTDNGDPIIRKRIGPHVWNALERVYYESIQFDIEVGVGLVSGQGSDPKIMLRWSNDGGNTWSNEYLLSIGKIGEYLVRAKKNRLGASRDRVFELTYSEPTPFNVLNMFAEIS